MLWRFFRKCDHAELLDHHVSCKHGSYRKNEAGVKIKDYRKDKDNKYQYQANVNTLIGSLRDKLADAVFSRKPAHRQKKLERIMTEIQKSVVPIRPDDGNTSRYANTRKDSHHHNKRHNL